jgi:ATP-dependent Clp protease ATP-binding subunit ClpB
MNRIDKVIVFRRLRREHLEEILDIELEHVQDRIMSPAVSRHFVFSCAPGARAFLLAEGTDSRFGARHLKRSIERHLVLPFSNLLATAQIELGDMVTIDFDSESRALRFVREERGALVGADAENLRARKSGIALISHAGGNASRALVQRGTEIKRLAS